MHVTVSMPTWQTPPHLLGEAVASVLAQTHHDLHLIVCNDGGPALPRLPADSRLTVVDLPANRGRYRADAAVLAVAPPGLFAVVDSDDWVHPDHLAMLVDKADAGAVLAPYWRIETDGRRRLQQVNRRLLDGRTWGHITHWCAGVYDVERARRAGGIMPAPRVGFDTLHTLLICLTGPVAVADEPTFTWRRRRGSLTTTHGSGFGSHQRERAKALLRRVHRAAVEAHDQHTPVDVAVRRFWPAHGDTMIASAVDTLRSRL